MKQVKVQDAGNLKRKVSSRNISSNTHQKLGRGRVYPGLKVRLSMILSGLIAFTGCFWVFLLHETHSEMSLTAWLVFSFGLLLAAAGFKLIELATEPLNNLTRLLDDLNLEDDLTSAHPALQVALDSSLPEVAQVAKSYEQLLQRLNGYRALNFKRLLIEKRRADVIAASISDGIFLLRGSEILYVNPVGEHILDLPKGLSWKGLNLKESGSVATKALVALRMAIDQTIPVELERVTHGNRKVYYLLQAHPISNKIVEEVEHSLQAPTDEPFDQMLERFQATTLILAQDTTLVRESQDAKSHFIATLSHEVKTPVTSLTMATRLLRKGVEQVPNPTHRSLIHTCAEDVDRLRGLIEDLLSVSSFDTLTQKLEIKYVDIGKLLKQTVLSFQTQADERSIELRSQVQHMGKPIQIPMDAAKVSWALSNLLINALRHAPVGGKVQAEASLTDGFVEIRIRDNGPGIEKNRLTRIFDKFNPYYDLRIARSGSIGMGLSIAKEIIAAHSGRIWVNSELGSGSEFCFSLPLERSGAQPGLVGHVSQNGQRVLSEGKP